jgi:hypothetical protein
MGQTFVYNFGEAEIGKDEIKVSFGVFIDGTLNNKTNKELRDVHGRGGSKNEATGEITGVNKDLTNAEIEAQDKVAYDNMNSKDRKRIEALMKNQNRSNDEEVELKAFSEKDRYLVGSKFSGTGTDTSFSNDHTNVARMYYCCKDGYRIYVEGMGTEDNEKDSDGGFMFGSGKTGIRNRVRKGCEDLAVKIFQEVKNNKTKTLSTLTVDISGFSRGATAARNFAYEINRKKAYKPTKKRKAVVKSVAVADSQNTNKFEPDTAVKIDNTRVAKPKMLGNQVVDKPLDDDGMDFDESLLVDGMMPKFGHLGYSLLKLGMTAEELEQLTVIVRFLGIYETVSSYYEEGDNIGTINKDGQIEDTGYIGKTIELLKRGGFTDNIEFLHLNDFGYVQKTVHFTAQNEHRENFDLTRVVGAQAGTRTVERNFPGVHCDIGGAYENEGDDNEQLETSAFVDVEDRMQELLDEYWYVNNDAIDELKISNKVGNFFTKPAEKILGVFGSLPKKVIPFGKKLHGTRKIIHKEYSYIPLHFMEEYAKQTPMGEYFDSEVATKYPLNNEFLDNVKNFMRDYAMDMTGVVEEWQFISDIALKQRKLEREQGDSYLENLKNPIEDRIIKQDNTRVVIPNLPKGLPESKPEIETPVVETECDDSAIQLKEVLIVDEQKMLRTLRNKFLHWSASRVWFGMEPRQDRKRVEY